MNTSPAGLITVGNLTLRRVPGTRTSIRTDRSGMLTIVLPETVDDEQARTLVLRHYGAISRWLAVGEAVCAWEPIVKELVTGEGFPLCARSHRMRWQQPDTPYGAAFEPTEHGVWLKVDPAFTQRPDAATAAIIECYQRETIDVIRRRFDQYADRLGVSRLATLALTDDGARWVGLRAGQAGIRVTAHWALSQFSVSSVDYLLCRALCARAKRDVRVFFPDPYAARRMHDEARDVWTGETAERGSTCP